MSERPMWPHNHAGMSLHVSTAGEVTLVPPDRWCLRRASAINNAPPEPERTDYAPLRCTVFGCTRDATSRHKGRPVCGMHVAISVNGR